MATDIASPFPDLTWRDQSIISVDTGNASAKITTFTIHLAQDTPDEAIQIPGLPAYFAFGPEPI